MARPVVLSNGSLFVGLNHHGLVHDFYYPYVGLDNLTNARSAHHKIGLWVDGVFSWVDDDRWRCSIEYCDGTLISQVVLQSTDLELRLETKDFIVYDNNIFVRNMKVTNLSASSREVRLFMHQVFQISRAGRADTALFVPDGNYIYDYKGSLGLLIYAEHQDGRPFDQFAIGNYGIEGKEGTFRDAEDGELSGNPVEHGGVDTVIRLTFHLGGGASASARYWVAAASSQSDAEASHKKMQHIATDRLIEDTSSYWKEWLATAANKIHPIDRKYLPSIKASLLIIKAHCDNNGGILASGDSSIYNYGRDYYSYVWPRDAAYAIWPLIRLGFKEEPRKFFKFCKDIMHKDGYVMHKYQPDKSVGSTWHPLLHTDHSELAIQEDETAIIIYMLGEYYAHSKDDEFVESMYENLVRPMANFLCRFIDERTGLPHASYDIWEEKFLTSTYTTAIVYQALLVAAELAEVFAFVEDKPRWIAQAQKILAASDRFIKDDGTYRKGFLLKQDGTIEFDDTLDVSSLYGVMMYGLYKEGNAGPMHETARAIIAKLSSVLPSGGIARHEADYYFLDKKQYPGNPWNVTTLWLAQYYLRIKQQDEASKMIEWSLNHSLPSGALSEQLDPETGDILSVTPLVWSHAELINTILDDCHIQ